MKTNRNYIPISGRWLPLVGLLAFVLFCQRLSFSTDNAIPDFGAHNGIDIKPRRPTAGPRDLIIVNQSQPLEVETDEEAKKQPNSNFIKHFSFATGAFFSFSLDPLVFLQNGGSDGAIGYKGIKNRIELDFMAALGIANWFELDLAFPIVLFQQSEAPGNTLDMQAIGDLSVMARVPILRRLSYVNGIGLALAMRANFPTGSVSNYVSDGVVTYNPSVIVDYRFGFGGLITFQPGLHIRPGVVTPDDGRPITNTLTLSAGFEMPIKRSWGLSFLAGFYINVLLDALPAVVKDPNSSFKDGRAAGEGMLGLRWYADHGVTYTTGLNIGGGCSLFSIPSFRYFIAAIWTPKRFKEYQAIMYFKNPPDQDGDGILDGLDSCPSVKGDPNEKRFLHGCPDADGDKMVDFLDRCKDTPGVPKYYGCPRAYLTQKEIITMESVRFATDQVTILQESFNLLEDITVILKENPSISVEIGGHTDNRYNPEYNLELSQRRSTAVEQFLIARGIAPNRLIARGYGATQPVVPNATTEQQLAQNRRVTFTIIQPTTNTRPTPTQPAPNAPVAPQKLPTPTPQASKK